MTTGRHDCVGALLVRGDRVLLVRRSQDREWLPGAWALPGGHLRATERPEEALGRELGEELGVVPLQMTRVGVLEGGGVDPWHLQVFAVEAWDGDPGNRQPREHAELRWCGLAQAQRLLASAHPGFAALLREGMRRRG